MSNFLEQLKGKYYGILKWSQLDDLWTQLKTSKQSYYVYQVGDDLPDMALEGKDLETTIDSLSIRYLGKNMSMITAVSFVLMI
jgi:hypothetical protein